MSLIIMLQCQGMKEIGVSYKTSLKLISIHGLTLETNMTYVLVHTHSTMLPCYERFLLGRGISASFYLPSTATAQLRHDVLG